MRATSELVLARGARIAANGQATADWARSRLRTEVATLPPAVDRGESLTRLAARKQLDLSPEGLFFGVVGRLSSVKWPLLAVEAVAQTRLRATLVFVGEGPEREAIVAAAKHHGVRVHLAGSVVGASRLMTAFDAVLSCSPHETFGLAAAEAIVAGVPVVAVDAPGLRALTDDGRWLRLVSPEAVDLAAALEATVAGGLPAPELREHVLSEFGPDASAVRLGRYYAAALSDAVR